jgi:hypothetical protein
MTVSRLEGSDYTIVATYNGDMYNDPSIFYKSDKVTIEYDKKTTTSWQFGLTKNGLHEPYKVCYSKMFNSSYIPDWVDDYGNVFRPIDYLWEREEIEFKDILSIAWKEARVAAVCGAVMAFVCFFKVLYVDSLFTSGINVVVAIVVSLAIFTTVVLAKIVGCTLPMFAKRIGLDPAVMASPFITTIVDALSLIIYFVIVTVVLL